MIEPLVLRHRQVLPSESAPSAAERYDRVQQLWIDEASGRPLVERLSAANKPSQFGETILTENREGTDLSDNPAVVASQFGETIATKAQEGTDQSGERIHGSEFGESVETYTREGTDHAGPTGASHAPHAHL